MELLDQNKDNDITQLIPGNHFFDLDELSDIDDIIIPADVPENRREEYLQMARQALQNEGEYLLFVRDDTKGPLNPITIDFMYKIVSINRNFDDNIIIEMKDFSGASQNQTIKVQVYEQNDPDVLQEVIEKPYIIRQPINKWIHLMFRYDASIHTWSAFYEGKLWFTRKDDPHFSPEQLNYIKVYTKIPYTEGGNFEAYVANLTISKNSKDVKYYPPYPRDYGPIFIGGDIKLSTWFWRDTRVNIIEDPNIILWWPVRQPLNIWEIETFGGFGPGYIYQPFTYGGNYIRQYTNFPPALYGGYWYGIPAIGPGHPSHVGIATFRRGGLTELSIHQNITIESWLYIQYTTYTGGWARVYNFVGAYGNIEIVFNGVYFRVWYGEMYWDIPEGNYINQWMHVALSYEMSSQTLRIFFNGIIVLVITLIVFIPIDIIVFTYILNSGMHFYHIGLRSTIITKYIDPFDTLIAIYPPYTIFPGNIKYPVYPTVLPSGPVTGVIFRYPITLDKQKYETNGTYYLYENKVELDMKTHDDKSSSYPIISNITKDLSMETTFIDSRRYRVPNTYTLEFWIYVREPYTVPDTINMDYVDYDYVTLLIGSNGVYLGIHKKDNTNMAFTRTFNIDLADKWNHIAITCSNRTNFSLFVNGQKIYTQNNPNETFNIYHLFMSLSKLTETLTDNNLSRITMWPYIKYNIDFNYKHVRSKPDGVEV